LEIASTEHASIHRQLESLQRDLFLSTASGDALDRIGDLLGTTRGQSTRAFDDSRNVRLRIDPTTGEVASSLIRNRLTGIRASATGTPREDEQVTTTGFVIVEGTTLTSNTGATYLTTQDVVFVNDDVEKFVPVIATQTGPSSNVTAGALNQHNISVYQPQLAEIADFILVDNRMPISTGALSESDESYRFRLQQAIFRIQSSNQGAIISAALSVPGIRNATFLPYTRGVQTFSVIIETVDPIVSDGMVAAAKQAVDVVTAAGNRGEIIRPIYRALRIKVALRFKPEASREVIRQRARGAGIDYINSIDLGDPFIINELIQRLMDTSDDIFDLQFQTFASGIYDVGQHIIVNEQSYDTLSNLTLLSRKEHWYSSDVFFTVCDLI
jgi:uncharacterized phage protein gp47/JayE